MINCDLFQFITLKGTIHGFVSKSAEKFRKLIKYLKLNHKVIFVAREISNRTL